MDQENIDKNEIYLYYFIENVVKLRKHFHLSKAQMAGIMGIGIQSIRKIEQHQFPPRLGMNAVFNLEAYFNIPAHQLFLPINL